MISLLDVAISITCKQFCKSVVQVWYWSGFSYVRKLRSQCSTIYIFFKSQFNSTFWNDQFFPKARFSPNMIHSIGRHVSDHWEMRTSVQSMAFSRHPNPCPFTLFFSSCRMWRLHVWFFIALSITFEIDSCIVWYFTTLRHSMYSNRGGYWKRVCLPYGVQIEGRVEETKIGWFVSFN